MKDNYIDSFLAQEFGKSQNYNEIKNGLFSEFNVKKGLRNEDGTGVRVGLTKVSDVVGYDIIDGVKTNVDGKLYYRGYSLNDLVDGSAKSTRGYEEVMFLLLFGFLPNKVELDNFSKVFRSMYALPNGFFEGALLRNPGKNLSDRRWVLGKQEALEDPLWKSISTIPMKSTEKADLHLFKRFPLRLLRLILIKLQGISLWHILRKSPQLII